MDEAIKFRKALMAIRFGNTPSREQHTLFVAMYAHLLRVTRDNAR